MEHIWHVPTPDSPLHGVLVIDKPGLEQSHGLPVSDRFAPAAITTPPAEKESLAATSPVAASADRRLPTSHDVVQMVRRWSGQRRIGHTGTLDPMASGVLVLCLGHATRLVEYYQGHDKQYCAEIALGAATDTYDATGQVTAAGPVPQLSRERIERVLDDFRGPILQRPPIYSALKVEGEALYRKARRGEAVALKPRPLSIHELDLLDYVPGKRICLRILCSAGTYIRSLAHDLGRALETHAHLASLRRQSAGPFHLNGSVKLDAVQHAAQEQRLADLLFPLGYGLSFPTIRLSTDQTLRFGFGQKVVLDQFLEPGNTQVGDPVPTPYAAGMLAQALNSEGEFAGLIRCLERACNQGSLWKAEKWFIHT